MSAARTITAIKPLPRDPNLRRVHVNGKAMAVLRAADVEALRIADGQSWTESLAAKVEQLQSNLRARRDAMRMLGKRAYSRGELIERLIRRGHEERTARTVADELAADQWIDDVEYGRDVARSIATRRGASREFVRSKLIARKLDPALATQIASTFSARSEDAEAIELAQQSLGRMNGVPPEKAARRVAGALARRGFDESVITHVLEQIGLGENQFDFDETKR